jgi:hypothetical protein
MTDTKAPRVKRKLPLDPESESWHKLPWRKFEQHVYRIQKRIFRAEQRGNVRAVHKLQKLLMKSRAARLIAVRRVTQENQGKKTAGIDGVLCRQTLMPIQKIPRAFVEAAGSYNAALDLIHTALRAESEGERYTGVLHRLTLAFALRV